MDFFGSATPLSTADVEAAAAALSCEPSAVWAVCDVESAGHGFLPDKRPKILFEARIFSQLTQHKYDVAYPNISTRFWSRATYGAPGAHQYDRLTTAAKLNAGAALEAASWGLFQILGLNYPRCGYATVEAYVADAVLAEGHQLAAFVGFVKSSGMARFLAAHDWTHFALLYNGPGERANGYDTKLALAYARRARGQPGMIASAADDPNGIGLAMHA